MIKMRNAFVRNGPGLLAVACFCLPGVAFGAGARAVPYDAYGRFEDVGTPKYSYRVIDEESLKRRLKPGIYPNVPASSVPQNVSAGDL